MIYDAAFIGLAYGSLIVVIGELRDDRKTRKATLDL